MTATNYAPAARADFYLKLQPVTAQRHGEWRLLSGDYAFAAKTPFVPLLTAEFGPAARHYPIVFSQGDEAAPMALLGLDGGNLFVDQGEWATDVHIPAFIRRYPFAAAKVAGTDGFALMIDEDSTRVLRRGAGGNALFDKGKPSDLTKRAFAFCEAFRSDAGETREFCRALEQAGLLVDRKAEVTLPAGEQMAVTGFKIIDLAVFQALEADVVIDWHRRGWLAAAQFHLASLDRFRDLLGLRAASSASGEAVDTDRAATSPAM